MRKKFTKYGKWKGNKRSSFHFYFVLVAVIVSAVTAVVSTVFSWLVKNGVGQTIKIPSIVLVLGFGVIIGLILAYFAGIVFIKPISKLQSAMNAVTEGDLTVKVPEKSRFEEIENINHSFNIMIKELQSMQNMQKDFVSNVSHEFKTPLNAIEGYATLLQDSKLNEEEKNSYVKEILSTTKEMSDLITNILLLSKLTNQAIDYKKESVLVAELIRKAVVLLEPKWAEKEIEFEVDFEEISLELNESLMQNVFRNLIENAIKFSPKGGKITLSLKEEGEKVVFYVIDQGEGVSEKDKEHIFEQFYQGDTSHKQEGNGLGLSLVNAIVKTFKGEVFCEQVAEGCKFTIIIPK